MRADIEFKSDEMCEFSGLVCRTVNVTETDFLRKTMFYHAILFDEAFVDEQGSGTRVNHSGNTNTFI